MRLLIILLTIFLLTSCCCNYDEKDFDFTATHNKLLHPYTKGDTLYFSDKTGNFDTITISNVDTLQQCGCLMVGNRKSIAVEIKHLPLNRWSAGTEMGDGKNPPKVLDQNLIIIEKIPHDKNEKYFIGINYRDFMGELTDLTKMNTDHHFEELGVKNYWTIINESADWEQHKQNATIITRLFWTEKYGLTGYELRNGQTFKLNPKTP